jgi:hypothetical protein
VRIRVERANLERKILDFSLVGEDTDIFSTPAPQVFAPKNSKKGKKQGKEKKGKRN